MSSAALLEVEQLSVRFGTSTVVDQVSFSIAAGEKFALVGESGSGKSITALSVLRLVDAAVTSGAIRFKGEDLTQKSEREMRGIRGGSIGMIFQEPMTALNPLYTVGNQIGEVLELHQAMRPNAARARATELLARTGIPEPERRIDAYPHQLSGGQRQRAMIAMALACAPKLLICDEPTTALDVTIQAQILALLDALQAEMGMALLFITHDLNLVRRFTHRVGVMERGVAFGNERAQQVEDLRLDRHVERGRRLVRDQQLRLAGQRHRDHHALPHSTGELVRVVTRAPLRFRDADLLEQLDDAPFRLLPVEIEMRIDRLANLPPDGEHRVQRRHRVLEDHRDLLTANPP